MKADARRGSAPLTDAEVSTVVVSCPICESRRPADYELVGTASLKNHAAYDVLRCRADGVEFANALPPLHVDSCSKAALDQLYGDVSNDVMPRYADFMERVERVATPGGVLHDVGCGNGHLLVEAHRRGWVVQGNDVVAAVQPALEAFGFPYYLGSLHELNLAPTSCDVVTSFCVLPHHLSEPLPDLRAAVSLLRPGGWFILQLPDAGLYRKFAQWAYRLSGGRGRSLLGQLCQPGGHHFAYSRDSITLLLRKCGFTGVRIDDYSLNPCWSVRRFRRRPLWFRLLATASVYAIHGLSRVTRHPNHMFVYARKPVSHERAPTDPVELLRS